jgi:hypothetical protein
LNLPYLIYIDTDPITMPPKRVFLSCAKCSKDCIGRYKDDQDRPLCRECAPTTKKGRIKVCTKCGNGHYNMKEDDMCSKCRDKMNMRSTTVQRCVTCGTAMRTKIENMTECVNCIGRAKYQRLLYAHHKT